MTLRPDPILLDSNVSMLRLTKYGRIIVYSNHNYKDEVSVICTFSTPYES